MQPHSIEVKAGPLFGSHDFQIADGLSKNIKEGTCECRLSFGFYDRRANCEP